MIEIPQKLGLEGTSSPIFAAIAVTALTAALFAAMPMSSTPARAQDVPPPVTDSKPATDQPVDDKAGDDKAGDKTRSDCGFGSVYDWRAIDDRHLVIWFNSRKDENARFVELNMSCQGLRFADTIALDTRDRFRVCSYGGDAVLVDGQRCTIGQISAYDPKLHGDKLKKKRPKDVKSNDPGPKQ